MSFIFLPPELPSKVSFSSVLFFVFSPDFFLSLSLPSVLPIYFVVCAAIMADKTMNENAKDTEMEHGELGQQGGSEM